MKTKIEKTDHSCCESDLYYCYFCDDEICDECSMVVFVDNGNSSVGTCYDCYEERSYEEDTDED